MPTAGRPQGPPLAQTDDSRAWRPSLEQPQPSVVLEVELLPLLWGIVVREVEGSTGVSHRASRGGFWSKQLEKNIFRSAEGICAMGARACKCSPPLHLAAHLGAGQGRTALGRVLEALLEDSVVLCSRPISGARLTGSHGVALLVEEGAGAQEAAIAGVRGESKRRGDRRGSRVGGGGNRC